MAGWGEAEHGLASDTDGMIRMRDWASYMYGRIRMGDWAIDTDGTFWACGTDSCIAGWESETDCNMGGWESDINGQMCVPSCLQRTPRSASPSSKSSELGPDLRESPSFYTAMGANE